MYNTLVELETTPITMAWKHFQKHNISNLSIEEYQAAFKSIYYVSNVTKYRDFQYRLLVNAIFTNDKKAETQGCEYCNCIKQTLKHLLYEYPQAKAIWAEFTTFVQECMYEVQLPKIEAKHIFLNSLHANPGHIVNFMMLCAKQLIFARKCLGKTTNFSHVLYKIDFMQLIEKYNANVLNKIIKHTHKWAPYTGEIVEEKSSNQVSQICVNHIMSIDDFPT